MVDQPINLRVVPIPLYIYNTKFFDGLYPFGMQMPSRVYQNGNGSYRYSMNGQEKSDELNPNITTALYWEYDSRLGRRWNVDPKGNLWESLYLTFNGNPIARVDLNGLKGENNIYKDNKTGRTVIVPTNEHGDRVFHGDIRPGADINNLKVSDFDIHGSSDPKPYKGYKFDGNTDQFVPGNSNSTNSVVQHNYSPINGHAVIPPSQKPINTKEQPSSPKSGTETTEKATVVVGAVNTGIDVMKEETLSASSKLAKLAIPILIVNSAVKLANAINKDGGKPGFNTVKTGTGIVGEVVGGRVGMEVGAAGGFEIGWKVGLMFGPEGAIPGAVIGTIVGGVIGAFSGGSIGGYVAESLAEKLHNR